jgi:hypothetical protein
MPEIPLLFVKEKTAIQRQVNRWSDVMQQLKGGYYPAKVFLKHQYSQSHSHPLFCFGNCH